MPDIRIDLLLEELEPLRSKPCFDGLPDEAKLLATMGREIKPSASFATIAQMIKKKYNIPIKEKTLYDGYRRRREEMLMKYSAYLKK